ncbi:MAG: hypothetical protein H2064_02640 [Candidatus Dadabacteria bacterium]|nr:hypothetical protein [Candidatus Dadabacteria bacterium]|tara:strand:+ start:24436 stop:24921 length:486 start_codon:yes stop_codon:yes gene_type:complete
MENKIKVFIGLIVIISVGYFTASYFMDKNESKKIAELNNVNNQLMKMKYKDQNQLKKYIKKINTSQIKESELLLLINALNYNLSNSNNLTPDEIKILNTYRRNHIDQIESDLLKEMYLSSLIKINYDNNNCEEAKRLSNELLVFPAIKEDVRGFIKNCLED